MKLICVLFLAMGLFSCRQTKVRVEPSAATEQMCYVYIKGKDTATLNLLVTGTVATGNLDYKWFEKDKNSGSIAGEMRGDTLIANYTFSSEGTTSIRQVAFLKKGDQYVEGFADVVDKDGKTVFKHLSALDFSQSIAFEKVACK